MRRAMVANGVLAPLRNHIGFDAIADPQVSLCDRSIVDNQPLERAARILYMEYAHRAADLTLISNLPAALSIKWSTIQHEQCLLGGANTLDFRPIDDQSHYCTIPTELLIAGKPGRADALEQVGQGLVVASLHKGGR